MWICVFSLLIWSSLYVLYLFVKPLIRSTRSLKPIRHAWHKPNLNFKKLSNDSNCVHLSLFLHLNGRKAMFAHRLLVWILTVRSTIGDFVCQMKKSPRLRATFSCVRSLRSAILPESDRPFSLHPIPPLTCQDTRSNVWAAAQIVIWVHDIHVSLTTPESAIIIAEQSIRCC